MAKKTPQPEVEESVVENEMKEVIETTSTQPSSVELNAPPTPREDPGHNSRDFGRASNDFAPTPTTEVDGEQEESEV
jgi:hypothetical protein